MNINITCIFACWIIAVYNHFPLKTIIQKFSMLGKEAMPPVLIGLTKGAVPRFGTTPFVAGVKQAEEVMYNYPSEDLSL
jgi:hypothetical protein